MKLLRALAGHFLLTLRLNVRSRRALAYGYVLPVFFLIAFGAVFQGDTPPLLGQMGQLLTITILGSACLGLPTALVAERERGVWRRYRLLPVNAAVLVSGVLAARLVIVTSAVALQLVLARLIYHAPWPAHPLETMVAFLFVTGSFLGIGLVVAALADDVPAVQALGQCLFLPMILIGGVGIPLAVLPVWAQRVAGFMPGRYAVEALQQGFVPGAAAWTGLGFDLIALVVIGAAAGFAGAKLFRWDGGRAALRSGRGWAAAALLAWAAIGGTAAATGHLQPVIPEASAWQTITDEQIARITYDDLPGDNEIVTRLAPPFDGAVPGGRLADFARRLRDWPPARADNAGQAIRDLVCVATIADLCQDPDEGGMARLVFEELRASFKTEDLRRALAWVVLAPDEGTVVRYVPELGLPRHPPERAVRQRNILYARKFLGRLTGAITAP